MGKKSIIQEAVEIAGEGKERNGHGNPLRNHQRIADIWSVQLGKSLTRPITPREVALMMIGLKLAREVHTPKRDNLVDVVGYVECIDQMDQLIRPS